MNLTKLLQDAYNDVGMSEKMFIATGGTTTTVVDGNATSLDDPPEDNYALDFTLFVRRDSAGAGAAPEGEFQRVSAYTSSGGTYTMDTALTAAVASGDEIFLANNEIPLRQMIWAANRALKEIGEVPAVPDTSLTTGTNQTEYTLPAAIQAGRIREVFYQGETNNANDNYWISIPWKTEQGTFGSTGKLIIPQVDDGVTLKIVYDGYHSLLANYNDQISESIPDKLIIAATTFFALRWYVSSNEGTEDFWRERINEAGDDMMRMMSYVKKVQTQIHGLPRWSTEPRYPGDSDALV